MRYCAVVPHEGIAYFKEDFRANPIGTGPFQFKKWEEDVKLVLRKNNRYFEKDTTGHGWEMYNPLIASFSLNS